MEKNYAIYWVAFKILLKKDNKVLFLTDSYSGHLDLPGGRADDKEGKIPIEKILQREVKEELGSNIKYSLGKPLFQFRRYSIKKKIYNLITIYEAKYLSGSIKLSPEHNHYEWINPENYSERYAARYMERPAPYSERYAARYMERPAPYKFKEKYFRNKEEYKAFQDYFKK